MIGMCCWAGASESVAWPAVLGTSQFSSKQRKGQQKAEAEALESKFCPNLSLSAATSRRLSDAKGRKSCLRGICGNMELALCSDPRALLALAVSIPREQHTGTHFYHPNTEGLI